MDAEDEEFEELDPEELGEETELVLTPPASRPGSVQGKRQGLNALVSSRPSSTTGSRRPSTGETGSRPKLPQLGHSASAPAVGALRPSSRAEVRAQRKESFHFKRQRRWLQIRNKQHCLSFTEQEIVDFRRFFDALTKGKETMPKDEFEDLLVCLDLATSRKDIRDYTEPFQPDVPKNDITFADFLLAFEKNLDTAKPESMDVLKLLLKDTYDPRDMDYPTYIAERRRMLILTATGAKGSAAQQRSFPIVRTFADLLEDRCHQVMADGSSEADDDGCLLMGGLGTMWKVACTQHGLARAMTIEERMANFKKELPLSPRTVVKSIVKPPNPKMMGTHRMGATLVIEADSF